MKINVKINKEIADYAESKMLGMSNLEFIALRSISKDKSYIKAVDKLLYYAQKLSFQGEAMRRYRDGLLLYKRGEDFQGTALDSKMAAFVKNVSIHTVKGWITRGLPVEQDKEAGNIRIYPHILDQWLEAENIRV